MPTFQYTNDSTDTINTTSHTSAPSAGIGVKIRECFEPVIVTLWGKTQPDCVVG